MKLLIRTDASVHIGTGHVMRCLTIAEQFRDVGCEVVFQMKALEGHYIEFVKRKGFRVVEQFERADVCLIDHYKIDITWESRIRPYVKKLIVIDDLADRPHDCDILLDQNVVCNYQKRYDHLVPTNCLKLLGSSYLILRREFMNVRQQLRKRTGEVRSVLVFMGGTDPTGETVKVLDALNHYNPFEQVHIVVGASNPQKKMIHQTAIKLGYSYHEQVDYLAKLMNEVDFSIGAGGSTTWERCFIGLPASSTIVATNQIDATEEAARLGVVKNLGWYQDVTGRTYQQLFKSICKEQEKNVQMSRRGLFLTKQATVPHPLVAIVMEDFK